MNVFLFALLSLAASGLFIGSHPRWHKRRRVVFARGVKSSREAVPDALPRLVRQITSLLSAGRTGPHLWSSLTQVLMVEQQRTLRKAHSDRRPATPSERRKTVPGRDGKSPPDPDATLLLVLAVERGSSLGLPVADAVRGACNSLRSNRRHTNSSAGRDHHGVAASTLTPAQRRMWLDVAACFAVCEESGAAVADVLDRLARTLEAEQDAAALRETALAGPRATVRLLNWLPFIGLGLGFAMGVDPFAALLSGPVGWWVLGIGISLALAGRLWSARMIVNAARPSVQVVGTKGRRVFHSDAGLRS